ncbi:MAG: hypothetical protein K5656_05175 [Lachnospiraceae bacterium]|nr:hypothetical protein [Lachnospiraceae bacterium]
MSKVYYIDSENVGDNWIELVAKEDSSAIFLVFYTDHSPRIQYDHMIHLMAQENSPKFVRCVEGNNALDFQLVTYLGFRLGKDLDQESYIVSNDTGFDAVVNFWTKFGKKIARITSQNIQGSKSKESKAKETKAKETKAKETKAKESKDSKPKETKAPVSADKTTIKSAVGETKQVCGVPINELYTIISCLGKNNPSHINLAYVHFYGAKKGSKIYKHMKEKHFSTPAVQWKRETKVKKFSNLIFQYCNPSNVNIPSDICAFLDSSVSSNDDKKSMKQKLIKKYGEAEGTKLNKILKPFYTAISKIKK